MSPKLRSIFAQVHRKSLSMGSRRGFSSSSSAVSSSEAKFAEWDKLYTFGGSFKLGLFASASFVVYKVYNNYYPKLLIRKEEHKRLLQRHSELRAQVGLDLDI
ncbi:unnamed protein product [Eruca vesicaria subsp. sativa]|uniref:Uncharacterized protein n=1 Tax=Eruca vesicaria subsp. sativa TaxID=29727 RepID=A0ABC8JVG3_ERUVS|nr:unnamed protein product [Eruca vesicaria subsp. sativa]